MFIMFVCKFATGLPSGCQLGFYQIMSPLHHNMSFHHLFPLALKSPMRGGQLRYLFIYLVARPSVLS